MITIFDWVSRIITIIFAVSGLFNWLKSIFPVLARLGMGLSKRKIAIFASANNYSSLKDLLVDSKLFNTRNIIQISTISDLGKSEKSNLFLVFWPDWKDNLNKILSKKNDSDALVVYAPQSKGSIPKLQMDDIDNQRNAIVTNFRGRLLNDIVI